MRNFEYEELRRATKNFSISQIIGKGSHGCIYKGSLDDGQVVAIKRSSTGLQNLQDNSKLDNEARILSSLPNKAAHNNVVNLLGTSHDSFETNQENKVSSLVMEFMPNGSLHDLLHAANNVTQASMLLICERRAQIALEIAKALRFIHSLKPKVIHRDIKSTNILFDKDWKPKLIDFGLAIRLDDDENDLLLGRVVSVSQPAGTIGYLDPSYTTPCMLSTKNDVFSFGVVLLEIITGQKVIDASRSTTSLIELAIPLIKHRKFEQLFDQKMMISGLKNEVMSQLLGLAACCVSSNVDHRPTSDEIVSEMENSYYCLQRVRTPTWVKILRGLVVLKRRRSNTMTPKKRANIATIKCVACQRDVHQHNNEFSSRKLLLRDILADATD